MHHLVLHYPMGLQTDYVKYNYHDTEPAEALRRDEKDQLLTPNTDLGYTRQNFSTLRCNSWLVINYGNGIQAN